MADRRLQVFHTVARLLSFTKAAETLHMTQPAVTFQVRQLEEHFNTRLFDRTHNRISLTEAGRRAYEYADRIFELYNEMENSIREMTGEIRGALTIGASTTIAEYMLPTLLGDFKAKYPDVEIHLKVSNTDGIVSMVENNAIDLGVVEAPVTNKNLVVEVCRMDQLVAILTPKHPMTSRSSLALQELVEYPFICRGRATASTSPWSSAARRPSTGRWRRAWASRWSRALPCRRSSSWALWWRSGWSRRCSGRSPSSIRSRSSGCA